MRNTYAGTNTCYARTGQQMMSQEFFSTFKYQHNRYKFDLTIPIEEDEDGKKSHSIVSDGMDISSLVCREYEKHTQKFRQSFHRHYPLEQFTDIVDEQVDVETNIVPYNVTEKVHRGWKRLMNMTIRELLHLTLLHVQNCGEHELFYYSHRMITDPSTSTNEPLLSPITAIYRSIRDIINLAKEWGIPVELPRNYKLPTTPFYKNKFTIPNVLQCIIVVLFIDIERKINKFDKAYEWIEHAYKPFIFHLECTKMLVFSRAHITAKALGNLELVLYYDYLIRSNTNQNFRNETCAGLQRIILHAFDPRNKVPRWLTLMRQYKPGWICLQLKIYLFDNTLRTIKAGIDGIRYLIDKLFLRDYERESEIMTTRIFVLEEIYHFIENFNNPNTRDEQLTIPEPRELASLLSWGLHFYTSSPLFLPPQIKYQSFIAPRDHNYDRGNNYLEGYNINAFVSNLFYILTGELFPIDPPQFGFIAPIKIGYKLQQQAKTVLALDNKIRNWCTKTTKSLKEQNYPLKYVDQIKWPITNKDENQKLPCLKINVKDLGEHKITTIGNTFTILEVLYILIEKYSNGGIHVRQSFRHDVMFLNILDYFLSQDFERIKLKLPQELFCTQTLTTSRFIYWLFENTESCLYDSYMSNTIYPPMDEYGLSYHSIDEGVECMRVPPISAIHYMGRKRNVNLTYGICLLIKKFTTELKLLPTLEACYIENKDRREQELNSLLKYRELTQTELPHENGCPICERCPDNQKWEFIAHNINTMCVYVDPDGNTSNPYLTIIKHWFKHEDTLFVNSLLFNTLDTETDEMNEILRQVSKEVNVPVDILVYHEFTVRRLVAMAFYVLNAGISKSTPNCYFNITRIVILLIHRLANKLKRGNQTIHFYSSRTPSKELSIVSDWIDNWYLTEWIIPNHCHDYSSKILPDQTECFTYFSPSMRYTTVPNSFMRPISLFHAISSNILQKPKQQITNRITCKYIIRLFEQYVRKNGNENIVVDEDQIDFRKIKNVRKCLSKALPIVITEYPNEMSDMQRFNIYYNNECFDFNIAEWFFGGNGNNNNYSIKYYNHELWWYINDEQEGENYTLKILSCDWDKYELSDSNRKLQMNQPRFDAEDYLNEKDKKEAMYKEHGVIFILTLQVGCHAYQDFWNWFSPPDKQKIQLVDVPKYLLLKTIFKVERQSRIIVHVVVQNPIYPSVNPVRLDDLQLTPLYSGRTNKLKPQTCMRCYYMHEKCIIPNHKARSISILDIGDGQRRTNFIDLTLDDEPTDVPMTNLTQHQDNNNQQQQA